MFVSDNCVHYFLLLLRDRAHVVFTQMVSTHDANMRGSLDFPNLIKLNDVTMNFKYDLEIYAMVSLVPNTVTFFHWE